jgi:hypothetical protein
MERPLAICLVCLAAAIVLTAAGIGWAAFVAGAVGVVAVFMMGWASEQAKQRNR